MDRRSTSRQYGTEFAGIVITPADLDIIKSNANDILRSEHGFDVPRAYVNAVLMELNKRGVLLVSDTQVSNALKDSKNV